MKKVITYGTFDLLHYGHIRLLERAKALGDYLIVGVTADDFDKTRGKINVQQSFMERVEGVRALGLADEIIIEEYEGQKIDDINRYGIDIFAIGSDWKGKFDYLCDYCSVVYLDRTEGVSSSEIRTENREIRIGVIGESRFLKKFVKECTYVNGAIVVAMVTDETSTLDEDFSDIDIIADSFEKIKDFIDAVYVISTPNLHYEQVKAAVNAGKHVLCELPIALHPDEVQELHSLAKANNVLLVEGLKTAYSTAYARMLLMIKSGVIGKVISVDATCTSLREDEFSSIENEKRSWNSLTAWGTVAMLPVFQIMGTNYSNKQIVTKYANEKSKFDIFTRICFTFPDAVASIKVGKGIKSEGELIITGTKGYVYVPAPWWKTDYFEIRYENQEQNRRYFYQLEGEGIRYMIVAFISQVSSHRHTRYIGDEVSMMISSVIEDYYSDKDVTTI